MYLYYDNPTNSFAMVSSTNHVVNIDKCVIPSHQSDFDARNIKCLDGFLGILRM